MIKCIGEVLEPIIGEEYQVPCVRVAEYATMPNQVIPIYGPLHDDKEWIGFEHEHWHIDWRFVGKRFFNKLARHNGPYALRFVVLKEMVVGFQYDVRRMFRRMPTYIGGAEKEWLPALEVAFSKHTLKCLTCPHRGFSLQAAPIHDGALVCPGHGLRWSLETKKLVHTETIWSKQELVTP